ncbi:hypothetical protein V1477_014840 [Vespula maculifrons]|uniref:Uncharacterized protein n=1 Tax=Vespula maculifrons TaxID=7453 RepID=A0ABD2BJ35_VESMC
MFPSITKNNGVNTKHHHTERVSRDRLSAEDDPTRMKTAKMPMVDERQMTYKDGRRKLRKEKREECCWLRSAIITTAPTSIPSGPSVKLPRGYESRKRIDISRWLKIRGESLKHKRTRSTMNKREGIKRRSEREEEEE